MSWLFFALLAPAIYAISNFIDKYNIEKQIRDYFALPVYTTIVGALSGVILLIFYNFPVIDIYSFILVIGSGISTIVGILFYYKAIILEEVSNILFYFQIQPLLLILLSFFLLNESISKRALLGFFLIFISVLGVSIKFKKGLLEFSSGIVLILLSDLIWVIGTIMLKIALNTNSFYKVIPYESFGIAIGGILLFIFILRIKYSFMTSSRVLKFKVFIIFINEILYVVAKYIGYYALF